MGLEEVKKEILDKAEQTAAGITAEARKEVDKIKSDTDKEIKEYRDKVAEDTKTLIGGMERKEKASAEFDVKKMKLDRKKDIIDRVFDNVRKKLQGMPESKRADYIKKLLEKSKKEINVKHVHASSNDKAIVHKIKGVTYQEADIIGGIISENDDGTISVDYSYDELLDTIAKDNMQEIAAKLFRK